MSSVRAAWIWILVAGLVRALVAWRTVVPSHDAAFFLWAGERVAGGEPSAAFQILFQPLYPLLTGLVVWSGLGAVHAGQLVACAAGVLAVLPLFMLTRELVSRPAAHVACALYAFGLWFCRHPAACLSEGVFYLLVTTAAWCIVSDRPVRAGVAAALAYATRPEGVLVLLLTFAKGRAGTIRLVLAFGAVALLVPLGFWLSGAGFLATSKSGFVWQEGVGGVLSREGAWECLLQYLENVARNVGVSFEAVGYLTLPLALFGLFVCSDKRLRLLFVLFVAQLLVASVLRSHVRFLSGYAVLLLPLAAAGIERLRPPRVGRAFLLVGCVLLPDLARLPRAVNAQRAVLIPLGGWLRQELPHDGALATDLARLEFLAGQRPWLPRRVRREEFLERCREPRTRFVVFVRRRGQLEAADLTALGYRPAPVPARFEERLRQRDMAIYRR